MSLGIFHLQKCFIRINWPCNSPGRPEKTFVRWTRGRIAIGCLVFIGGWGFNLIVAQPTYLLSYGSEIQIMSDWNWTWLALAGIYFWYISYLPYTRSRVYFKGVSCYLRQTSIHWEVIPGQCVWPVDTNQWVEINPSAGSTGCTIKDHHYAAINTTVILCNYEDKSVNNPGEIYDCISLSISSTILLPPTLVFFILSTGCP